VLTERDSNAKLESVLGTCGARRDGASRPRLSLDSG